MKISLIWSLCICCAAWLFLPVRISAQNSNSTEEEEEEQTYCDLVFFETEVIERQNSIADQKEACIDALADLVEHFGPPRDDMFLEVS